MKKKIYIAKRIPQNPPSDFLVRVNSQMTIEEVINAYQSKVVEHDKFIHNGHWILRPPTGTNSFRESNLPKALLPEHIWVMVKTKIQQSDIFFAVINPLAFGTIAELGFAVNCRNIAVYVLPDQFVTADQLQDFWFVFQIAASTRNLWSDEHFVLLRDEFLPFGILSIDDYVRYINSIIPNFMKK